MNRKVLIVGLAVALPLLALLFANLGRDPHMVDSPLIGHAAPPFALRRVGGGDPVALADLKGRPVVLNFWATWCAPCQEEHPELLAVARALGASVQFLGVVYEDEEDSIVEYLKDRGQAYPSLMDDGGRAAIAYGVFGVPETFFINGEGQIVAKHVGPLDRDLLAQYVRLASGRAQ
jgi:cytochrome c biogenesis protein CcmG, thiol:disulfide interchange protein DsbE